MTTSAEDAAKILSEPVTQGYYVRGVTEGEPMRVVFAQHAKDDNKCDEELRAMSLVIEHRKETATRIVQILCMQGIYRGTQWVTKAAAEL